MVFHETNWWLLEHGTINYSLTIGRPAKRHLTAHLKTRKYFFYGEKFIPQKLHTAFCKMVKHTPHTQAESWGNAALIGANLKKNGKYLLLQIIKRSIHTNGALFNLAQTFESLKSG